MALRSQQTPNWQTISKLPTIAWAINGMLESAQEQWDTLQPAIEKPHVLDNYTVDRITSVFTTQQNDLGVYAEQLRRWQQQPLNATQKKEIARLETQLAKLNQTIQAILDLTNQFKGQTIDTILGKSDFELAMDILSGKIKPPRER